MHFIFNSLTDIYYYLLYHLKNDNKIHKNTEKTQKKQKLVSIPLSLKRKLNLKYNKKIVR